MSKNTYTIIGVIILVAVVAVVAVFGFKKQSVVPTEEQKITTESEVQPIPNTTPQKETSTAGSYTLAEVARHSTKGDCWTTINGSVYNVTAWIGSHPGGQDAILSLCGKDGSAAFGDQHSGDRRPASELSPFKIGTLSK